MTIREYAKSKDFTIIGKLTRHPEWEENKKERFYMDEGGNEYYKKGDSVCVVTADGGIM